MFANKRIVSFSLSGRKRNLALLDRFLRVNRGFIDSHEWWVNTINPGDRAFIYQLAGRHPDFYTAVELEAPYDDFGERIRHFYMQRCQNPETIYLKIDDDFCYIGQDAISHLLEFRLAHPEYFLVMPPTVNSALQTHVLQRTSQLPRTPFRFGYEPFDPNGLGSGEAAELIHHTFLEALNREPATPWTFPQWEFYDYEHATIGATCFFGRDLVPFGGDVTREDENFLSSVKPRELGRVCCVAPCSPHLDAFFAHYAYGPQKEHLDKTDVLSRYEAVASRMELI